MDSHSQDHAVTLLAASHHSALLSRAAAVAGLGCGPGQGCHDRGAPPAVHGAAPRVGSAAAADPRRAAAGGGPETGRAGVPGLGLWWAVGGRRLCQKGVIGSAREAGLVAWVASAGMVHGELLEMDGQLVDGLGSAACLARPAEVSRSLVALAAA
jgi:hypothetical protein